jgi:uncharacterized protein (DUF2235 family)
VRMLAAFLHLIGLLHPEQSNISGYALAAYERGAEQNDPSVAWHFKNIAKARSTIRFVGVWDTVASVVVPRADRLFIPSLLTLPYTRPNPSVAIVRHAIAIDERRRMFRLNRWLEPHDYAPNPLLLPSRSSRGISNRYGLPCTRISEVAIRRWRVHSRSSHSTG